MSQFFGGNRKGKYLNTNRSAIPEQEKPVSKKRHARRYVKLPSKAQIARERSNLEKKKAFRRVLGSTISVLLVVAAMAVLIATLFLPVLQISGTSMEPTLFHGDIVVLLKTRNYEQGNLCSFAYENKYLIKRIIGTPGDSVVIDSEGTVYVNGVALDEPYVTDKALGECDLEFPFQVPPEQYFVLGDMRESSIDSRNTLVGCVENEQIIGKIFFRVWPLKNFKFFG